MPQPSRFFVNNSIYHIYNRGVEKRTVFLDDSDFRHFLLTLSFYQQTNPEGKLSRNDYTMADRSIDLLFDIIVFCLMPNHFHLILKQLVQGGVSKGLSRTLNSYTRYFNSKYNRVGPLFQGIFKSVNVFTNEQFIHLARYIILNPYASGLTSQPEEYRWSSYKEHLNDSRLICNADDLNDLFSSREAFCSFVSNYADYARNLELIKHDVLD